MLSFIESGRTTATVAAAAIAAAYVFLHQVVLIRWKGQPWLNQLLGLAGVAAAQLATTLTGGLESPYLLLSLAPVLFLSSTVGWAAGLVCALSSALTLAGIDWLLHDELLPALVTWGGLYLLVGATFGFARRILVEADQVVARGAANMDRLERLEAAHQLLSRLSQLAEGAELDPLAAAATALSYLDDRVDFTGAVVNLQDRRGPIAVASRGDDKDLPHRLTVPLTSGANLVGTISLGRVGVPFSEQERALVAEASRPLALAFANLLILQDIGRRAVREERTRLARELHDEIGPGLASLGLALDMAAIQFPTEPALATHLGKLRQHVTGLVEDVRQTVADLRESQHLSLSAVVSQLADSLPNGGPAVRISIDERRVPKADVANELRALLSEAFRNAVQHAGATEIRVEGWVDYERGELTIADNGKGYDPATAREHRFGLAGMRERAATIGAELQMLGIPGSGTRVFLRWGQ